MLKKYNDFYQDVLHHVIDLEKLEYIVKNNKISSYRAGEGKISLARDDLKNL